MDTWIKRYNRCRDEYGWSNDCLVRCDNCYPTGIYATYYGVKFTDGKPDRSIPSEIPLHFGTICSPSMGEILEYNWTGDNTNEYQQIPPTIEFTWLTKGDEDEIKNQLLKIFAHIKKQNMIKLVIYRNKGDPNTSLVNVAFSGVDADCARHVVLLGRDNDNDIYLLDPQNRFILMNKQIFYWFEIECEQPIYLFPIFKLEDNDYWEDEQKYPYSLNKQEYPYSLNKLNYKKLDGSHDHWTYRGLSGWYKYEAFLDKLPMYRMVLRIDPEELEILGEDILESMIRQKKRKIQKYRSDKYNPKNTASVIRPNFKKRKQPNLIKYLFGGSKMLKKKKTKKKKKNNKKNDKNTQNNII